MIRNSQWIDLSAVLLVTFLPLACEKESKPTASKDASAPTSQTETIDPKLRQALAAASASAKASEDGPPPGGVFAPGQADRRHAKGAPTKIQIGSEGSEPRAPLPSVHGEPKPAQLSIAVRLGPRSALPAVDLALSFRSEKPKADQAADGGSAAAALVATVDKALPSSKQLGDLPAGADKIIAKLKGAQFRIAPSPTGGAEDITITTPAGMVPDLKQVLYGAAELLFALDVPSPGKPVGAGATWIAEGRHSFGGLDALSYRLYQLKGIDGGVAAIDVEVRQYAASSQEHMEGMPQGQMQQFDSVAQGHLRLGTESLSMQGDLTQRRVQILVDGNRALPVQLDSEMKFSRTGETK